MIPTRLQGRAATLSSNSASGAADPAAALWVDRGDAGTVVSWLLDAGGNLELLDGRMALIPTPAPAALAAELLRATLWALSSGGRTPVYVSRLLAAAAPAAALMVSSPSLDPATPPVGWEDHGVAATPETAMLRDLLDDLALLGDVADLGHGYWLPGPTRLVGLSAHKTLIVGGPSLALVPPSARQALVPGSIARVLALPPLAAAQVFGGAIPVQSDASWRRCPPGTIAAWAARVLRDTRLLPSSITSDALEAYAPSIAVDRDRSGQAATMQYHRWLPVDGRLPAGRYLVRLRTGRGRHTAIAELRDGRVTLVGEPVLFPGDVRRLCYGLDALAGRSIAVRLSGSGGSGAAHLLVRSALPGAELRVLMALGQLELRTDGRYYPQRWRISAGVVAEVVQALEAIGIVVIEDVDSTTVREPDLTDTSREH